MAMQTTASSRVLFWSANVLHRGAGEQYIKHVFLPGIRYKQLVLQCALLVFLGMDDCFGFPEILNNSLVPLAWIFYAQQNRRIIY